ncbi:MAG: glycosyltransferase [Myxococcota bacterium]
MFHDRHVALIVPARNEAASIPGWLPRVPSFVDQIVVVDNASTDETAAVARAGGAEVVHAPQPAYGAACAAGLAHVLRGPAELVVFMDADGSDDPTEMARLLEPIVADAASLVIGHRIDRGGMTRAQRLGTRVVCQLLALGFRQRVSDLGPFRAASRALLERLPLRDRGFGWTAEMQAQAMRLGATVAEVPVSWRPGQGPSEISGRWQGVLRAGRDLVRRSLWEILGARVDASHARWAGWASVLLDPIPSETTAALARAARRLPAEHTGSGQFLGRQYAGCGALIGAMPRCDFACRGCYLGAEANRIPPLSLDALDAQIGALRDWLGPGGNLQLTDGELTLRDPDELVELVRRARRAGLVPMLMTHGDRLLREPALLERLVREGGLREISIHVDTTQRGRRDPRDRYATRESELHDLRGRFAALVRDVRRRTGRPLEVATTVTVHRGNLDGVAGIVATLLGHADVFKMVSFQPMADVGRTEAGLAEGITGEALWKEIEVGLAGALASRQGHLGHPDCSRFQQGLVEHRSGEAPTFHPLFDPRDARESAVVEAALDRFGGLTFRLDDGPTKAARAIGLALRHGRFLGATLLPQLLRSARRFAPQGRLRLRHDARRGRVRFHYFNVVSHHFMSDAELSTPRGRARLASCAFQVVIDGERVSMCEANALDARRAFYAEIRRADAAAAAAAVEVAVEVEVDAGSDVDVETARPEEEA